MVEAHTDAHPSQRGTMTGLRLRITLVAGIASTMFATHVNAQLAGVRAGDDVRIRSEGARGLYTVSDVSGTTLTLRGADGSLVRVPGSAITRLDLHRGPRSRGRGALRGLGIGFAVGAVSGAVLGFADGDDSAGIISFTAEEKAMAGGLFFGAVGGLLGAGIGAAAPGQVWERVPLAEPAHIGLSPDGGLAVGYSLRF